MSERIWYTYSDAIKAKHGTTIDWDRGEAHETEGDERMTNPPKKKGTAFETYVLDEYLRDIWPTAERSSLSGTHDYGDFINCTLYGQPLLVEAKKRKKLTGEFSKWVIGCLVKTRRSAHKHIVYETPLAGTPSEILEFARDYRPWVIFMAGDKRQDPNEDLCVMPARLAAKLLQAAEHD